LYFFRESTGFFYISSICPTTIKYSKIEKEVSLMSITKKNKQKGFTLIELMVTIAIVGLLVVIALVAFSGQTDKARIAKTLQWSRSIEHLLGADAVGIWTFDEGSGTTAIDSSGYGNDGTIYGASYTTDTPSGHGHALEFNGDGDYVKVSGNNFSADGITISAWVYLTGSDYCHNIFGSVGGSNHFIMPMYPSNNWVYFYLRDDSGMSRSTYTSTSPKNQWLHITETYDGSHMKIYFNGIEQKEATKAITFDYTSIDLSSLKIGERGDISGSSFEGLIDDIRIYSRALTSAQVEALYYAGLDNLYNKDLIDKQEYQERLLAKQGF
jgi:prepilin-type N-terminal cleavage/methylation domain-containing protein